MYSNIWCIRTLTFSLKINSKSCPLCRYVNHIHLNAKTSVWSEHKSCDSYLIILSFECQFHCIIWLWFHFNVQRHMVQWNMHWKHMSVCACSDGMALTFLYSLHALFHTSDNWINIENFINWPTVLKLSEFVYIVYLHTSITNCWFKKIYL
jgi:hypothetical protein